VSLPLLSYSPPSPGSPAALELRQVRKLFGSRDVLRGIDLTVAPHEVVCLIGASGSGKSTLLRCVNLLEPVTSGSIWFSGAEITAPGVNPDLVRRYMGIVFQSYNLFPHMTVLRNITLGPVKALKMPRAEAERLARDLLGRFGLADRAGECSPMLRMSMLATLGMAM
jgi:polar amino acid transport system ATP-binding protein